ncbi:adhesion G protein-coupled receptor E5-like [Conger conger]|uniref:adhesion G protein-coupled receptor E5-like n=1 Tax=Conger conger TaxID=82655 RepID=UPI002A59A585|nr:adhesion G protein-coupled receptor E5-like [Conger conger]
MRRGLLLILGFSFSLMTDLALSQCKVGFQSTGEGCIDVDECLPGERPICGQNGNCSNTNGSYMCICHQGYRMKSSNDLFSSEPCSDIKECLENKTMCGPHTRCIDTPGSHSCTCNSGFVPSNEKQPFLASDGVTCKDVDECLADSLICGKGGDCNNTEGSYKCVCNTGFSNYGIALAKCDGKVEAAEAGGIITTRVQSSVTAFAARPGDATRPHQHCSVSVLGHPHPTMYCTEGSGKNMNAVWNTTVVNNKSFIHSPLELTCNNFAPEASPDQIPAKLDKALSLMRNACNALSNSHGPDGGQPDGEILLERLLLIIEQLLSAGPLNKNSAVSTFLKVVEDALRLIGPLLHKKSTRRSYNHTEVEILVERGQLAPKGEISLSSAHAHLDTHWETAAGDTAYPGFAAASLLTHKGLESSTNDSFQRLKEDHEHKGIRFSMNSKVVTVSVSNLNTTNLQKPVNFTFSHLVSTDENHSCVYWDARSAGGGWSTEGCEVVRSNANETECSCTHLSSFAVLMAMYELEDNFHLEVITWVGLSVSQLCLLLCVLTFLYCHSIQGTRNTIHLHLCVCLFIANLIFLAGISSTQNKVGCAVVAGLLHFFFLAAFCWMCLEGVQLYRMVVLVFNTTLRPLYMMAAGYGVPAIIVSVSAAIHPGGYGTDKHCWLLLKDGFIWSFFGPVCVIIMVNAFFFMITVWKLVDKFSSLNPDLTNLRKIKVFTVTAVAQLCVLGTMWIFGCFLFEETTNRPLEYIFTFLNSLQGTLLFVMHCLFSKQVRDEYGKLLSRCKSQKKKYSEFSSNQSSNSQAKSAQHTGESRI